MPKGQSKTPSSSKSLNLTRSLGQGRSSGQISAQHNVHTPARTFLSLADWGGPPPTLGLLPPRRPVDIPLLPQPPGLSELGREGARIVSAIINILKQRNSSWALAEFIKGYKTTYRIQYRVDAYRRMEQLTEDNPDEFPLLTSAYVGQFIKQLGRSRLKLRSDVNTDTILTDLGNDLLSEIFTYTECHWYA
ncbi:hypothetical protein BGZ81_008430 [Podila clonocystis]|nr:hypothetical protein BGZ81_008430 [Podila clonocystis]